MDQFSVFIPYIPRPQPRPRFTRHGHAYEPTEATEYKRQVGLYIAQTALAYGFKAFPKGTPVALSVVFRMPVPGSWPLAKRQAAYDGKWHNTSRPDVDNLLKALMDAANLLLWEDDAQVVSVEARKVYDAIPGMNVTVQELTDEAR